MLPVHESPPIEAVKPRFPKSAIAAITAGGILLGGGVTYSLWNDSATGTGSTTINTGELSIAADGSTNVVEVVGSARNSLPDGFLAVPGEVFEISQGFDVTLNGTHLAVAEIGLDYAGVDFSAHEGWSITGMTLTDPDSDPVSLDNNGAANITKDGVYSAVFTVEFDAANKVGQNDAVALDLTGITATLTQIAPH